MGDSVFLFHRFDDLLDRRHVGAVADEDFDELGEPDCAKQEELAPRLSVTSVLPSTKVAIRACATPPYCAPTG